MSYEFYDLKTEVIHNKLLNDDQKKDYKDFVKQITEKHFLESESNGIPKNRHLSLLCIQCIELYSRLDQKQIRQLFEKYAKYSSQTHPEKFNLLKDDTEKIIDNLINGRYSRSSNIMMNFDFTVNSPIVTNIKVSLDSIGAGFYKINYNIYLADSIRYEYWKIIVANFKTMLRITKNDFKQKYSFMTYNANYRKREALNAIQNRIKSEVNRIVKTYFSGIFIDIYQSVPMVLILESETAKYVANTYGKSAIYYDDDILYEDFFRILLNNDQKHEQYYYDSVDGNIYIPSTYDHFDDTEVFAIHIRSSNSFSATNELFWLNTIKSLYGIQFDLMKNIKTHFIEKSIHNSYGSFKEKRKRLNQLDAIIQLLDSNYDIEKGYFSHRWDERIKYFSNSNFDKTSDYFEDYVKTIDYYKEKTKEILPELRESYDKRKDDLNEKSNTRLQWIAIIFTLVTIFQAFTQCNTSEKLKEHVNNINRTYLYLISLGLIPRSSAARFSSGILYE